jgi:hypothetical protein
MTCSTYKSVSTNKTSIHLFTEYAFHPPKGRMMDADLEELVFKQNIPGKYHRWTEESDDIRHEHDDLGVDVDENHQEHEFNIDDAIGSQVVSKTMDKLLHDDAIPETIKTSILHERHRKHNTGVKVSSLLFKIIITKIIVFALIIP